ncbi:MAG: nucleotidyltransferase domain-containing protein [Terricaulis sp.]|nr:nucleotidyltransferase domain-containing protein [Terricaulis sp.]
MPASARAEILGRLAEIEAAHGVRVLLAVESGSRAWGFHSPDSDYDARFLYVRAVDDYLALAAPRDVIETPLEGLLDINGWDLGKALRLMMKGNSVVHEWLASPFVYRADSDLLPRSRRSRRHGAAPMRTCTIIMASWHRSAAALSRGASG